METDELEQRDYRPSFTPGRTWRIGFHVVLSSLALLALLVMGNYLAHRHGKRIYLSQAAAQELSPLTLRILENLTNEIKVIVFFDRREPLYSAVSSLIKEYEARSPQLKVEFVDYRMPGRADAIRQQYRLNLSGDTSRVIFDSNGQVRTVLSTELSEFGFTGEREITRTAFRGEQLFTSAIVNVAEAKPVEALFLQGHGEHELGDGDQGYSRFAKLLENNNILVRPTGPLLGTNDIPQECGLLIIAGPTRQFEAQEIARIEAYLNRGGRLLALFNFYGRLVPTGLEQLLYEWNVQVGFDWVQDPSNAQSDQGQIIVASNFGSHPIVRSLLRSSVSLVMPRSVTQRVNQPNAANAPKVTELLSTSSSGRLLVPVDEGRFTIGTENTAVPLAVAGERGGIQGVKNEKSASRYVVLGDSLFLSNVVFNHAANSDFANAILNWLTSRDSLLSEIGPSPVSEYQILLTQAQMKQVRWLFLALIPGAVLIFGFFVWLRRRF